uniref:Uncharacterized protein n=1 Tax=Rhizophora mucronata TaxID=61149 RepID=A0A2P2Q8V6_RHIMU
MNKIRQKQALIISFYMTWYTTVCPSIQSREIDRWVICPQYIRCFLSELNSDKSFNASSIVGLSDGLSLVQREAISTINFISSRIESVQPTSLSYKISFRSTSLGLLCMLFPSFVSLPLLKISRMISPNLYISMYNSSFVAVLNSPVSVVEIVAGDDP